MKRVAIAAVLVVAMVFGVVAFATAAAENVVVTAKVNPAFSMTINQNAVTFGAKDIGTTSTDNSTSIIVKSNKLWNFSKGGGPALPLSAVLSESTSQLPQVGIAKGVHNIVATYVLNLTTDAAYDLDANTDYTATYTYTAVQQ